MSKPRARLPILIPAGLVALIISIDRAHAQQGGGGPEGDPGDQRNTNETVDSRIGDGPGGREDLRDISPARGIQHEFEALRDGDRFWYSETILPWELEMIEQLRLSDIIRFNTEIGSEIPDDVFHVVLDSGERDGPRDRNRDRRGRDRRR